MADCVSDIFDGFPYVLTRIQSWLHHVILLPAASEGNLIEIARWQATANKLPTCLVLGRSDCVHFRSDGGVTRTTSVPHGAALTYGYLCGCKAIWSDHEEFLQRLGALMKYLVYHPPPDYGLGNIVKGGRPASPSEVKRLSGFQSGGVPVGLTLCPGCGDRKGECLDPTYPSLVVRVHCLCENDNLCARCGRTLHKRKVNANLYNPEDGKVWHVPGFAAFHHQCMQEPDS